MAAKKTSYKQKNVTITIDNDTLVELARAIDSLLEFAAAVNTAVSQPDVRAQLLGKTAKKAPKRKAAKKRGR